MTLPGDRRAATFRVVACTVLALLGFAANSVLCRLALRSTGIDPATFTLIRLVSGALALALIARLAGGERRPGGNWGSALALFAYAAAFSFAYLSLTAGTGALLLFAAVQATMVLAGLRAGERLGWRGGAGLVLALAGTVLLLAPGLSTPPPAAAAAMLAAGVAWGIYSLRGRGSRSPLADTAGNFLRAAGPAAALAVLLLARARLDGPGAVYAVLSGALASGLGYALWYAALPSLAATTAAVVQLAVPVVAALGGVALLGEPISARLAVAAAAVLGGIGLVATRGSVAGPRRHRIRR